MLGTISSLAGAAFIALLALVLFPKLGGISFILLVSLAGLFASLADSFMGATVQAKFYCSKDEKITEQHPLHKCGTETEHVAGWLWLNNDWVNFIAALASSQLALFIAKQLAIVA